jgi:hypothetical protein
MTIVDDDDCDDDDDDDRDRIFLSPHAATSLIASYGDRVGALFVRS